MKNDKPESFRSINNAVDDKWLAITGGVMTLGGMIPTTVFAADDDEIRIGYWPIVGGLPLYVALEQGFFKEAGLNVKGVKFASAQQIVEGMITGRIHGCANGTATGALGLGEITSPGLFKIICSNPSNHTLVLDEFLVPLNSTAKTIADLKGKKIACGPGIQNVTMAKIILEKNGFTNPSVIELPVGQHAPALAAGQIDGVYTLEPTGTVGRMKHLSRTLETGVISKYVLGNADAPWFGGAAALNSTFIQSNPDARKSLSPPTRKPWNLLPPTRQSAGKTWRDLQHRTGAGERRPRRASVYPDLRATPARFQSFRRLYGRKSSQTGESLADFQG